MIVQYVGPLEAVEIAATGDVVEPGGTVTVSDALGVGLCEQTVNWVPADAASVATLDGFCAWVAAHDKYVDPVTAEVTWLPRAVASTSTSRSRRQSAEPAAVTDLTVDTPVDGAQEG